MSGCQHPTFLVTILRTVHLQIHPVNGGLALFNCVFLHHAFLKASHKSPRRLFLHLTCTGEPESVLLVTPNHVSAFML